MPLQALLEPGGSISKVHGITVRKDGILWVPLFHPAAALHKPAYLPQLEADMTNLKATLDKGLD